MQGATQKMGSVRSQGSAGVNQAGKERTVTGACPSPAVCTGNARGHGSACARRAGWAASVTKIRDSAHPDPALEMPPA